MKIQDIILFFPRSIYSVLTKMVRTELNESVKDYIMENGMYHFTPNEEIADKIIQSEYLKTGNVISSYGIPCSCMFAGLPDIDTFAKNLGTVDLKGNPYIKPNMVFTAIKFFPKNRESLKNYKIRGLADDAIVYEGYCILPHKEIEKVKIVPDLLRDENGTPKKDKNGEYQIFLREANIQELIPGTNEYKAKEDYLKIMEERAKKYGYTNKNIVVAGINNVVDIARMEGQIAINSTRKNIKDIWNNFLNKIKQPKIGTSVKETLNRFSFKNKNPYRDKKFAKKIAKMQTEQSITQIELEEVLEEFNKTQEAEFLLQKLKELSTKSKDNINRTILLSMIIAQKEGILEKDLNKKIAKTVFILANEKNMPIEDIKDAKLMQKINSIIKDAKELDKLRFDIKFPKYKAILDPQALENKTSKQLINASYQLEFLTKNKKNLIDILQYKVTEKTKERDIRKELSIGYTPTIQKKEIESKGKSKPTQQNEKNDYQL